jgi:tetratricopeptide (TPR) repeat protein
MKYVTLLLLLLPAIGFAQKTDVPATIISGNEFYRQKQYAKAAELYSKALGAEPDNITARYNLAAALYRQDKKVEAMQAYTEIISTAKDAELLSKAWYNKGAILSKLNSLEESVEAYKNALRNNPSDIQARENLQKALLELKKKTPPKSKKEDQQKKKQEQQKKQQQPQMKPKEVEQRLKLLQQKEKEVQQRVQKEKSGGAGSQTKDW